MAYGKLVRDNIPDKIVANGETPVIRILNGDDGYKAELIRKLLEEAEEVKKAENTADITAELADVLETMKAYAHHCGIPWHKVIWKRLLRKWKDGGFKKRIFLIRVHPKESPTF